MTNILSFMPVDKNKITSKVTWLDENNYAPNQVDVLVTMEGPRSNKLIEESNSLKWVQTVSAGVDYLNLPAMSDKNILLSNASGVLSDGIAESVLGFILAEYRGLYASHDSQAQSKWNRDISLNSLFNKKVVIFGTGSIAQSIAKLLVPFNVDLMGVNRSGKTNEYFDKVNTFNDLSDDFLSADIVINAMPSTPENQHMFNKEMFARFTNKPFYISVGRGATTNEEDLVSAMHDGKLSAIGLDVFEKEPLDEQSPLWTLENTHLTSHISGFVLGAISDKFYEIFNANLDSFIKEQKLVINEVNESAGY